ncbi:S8 family serine peptidase [Microbacteriaceae bacterium VKM Ac-2855]|nr:S8 family serine peptidase [Microbacteriaceae bacterium VKM Ac-2855]
MNSVRRPRSWIALVAVASVLAAVIATPASAEEVDVSSFTASALTPDGGGGTGAKSATGRLAQSDPDLLARADAAVTPVMVKVDVDPVASYAGGIEGFAATSPDVTGVSIAKGSSAISAYTAYVNDAIAAAQAEATGLIPSATLLSTYTTVYGGFAMLIPANRAKDLLALGSVAAVQSNELHQAAAETTARTTAAAATTTTAATIGDPAPDADASTFIGADAVWPSLGGQTKAGEGLIVGVIDTGIWPEHPMLADNGIDAPVGGPWACEFGDGSTGPAFACNDKLIGAYAFLDTYISAAGSPGPEAYCSETACSARDAEGHGTHTATTTAGSAVDSSPIFGVDRGAISGVAPGASVIAYRALGPSGGFTGDLVAAIGQSVLDGVDVINYSISGSADPYDATEIAFLDAFAAGITVNSSAGNSGPGASTADHASPWTTTVGASTFDRSYTSTLELTSSDGATFVKEGTTITAGVTDTPVVLATAVPGYTGGELCEAPFAAGSVTGQVVVCLRGGNGRVEKGFNAAQGGAAGMILANPTASDVETDNHFLPAIHLEGPNDDLLAYLGDHPGVTATWAQGEATVSQGDVMAGFSSRGPIGDFLKPDITAPGVQILAGNTPTPIDVASGPAGELYQAIAGTSMSAPHAAGVSLLVKAAHPSWTPGQIKSALMTSSLQDVVNVDGSDAGVFDRGAGSIRADRAVAPVLTISESAADFAASATDELNRVDLNIPSVYVDPLPGAISTTRTVTNVSGSSQSFRVSATNEAGLRITVLPARFSLAAGASRDLTVLLDGLDAEDGWHEGQITITATGTGKNAVVLPVAANVGEAEISLTQSCAPTTIARGATTTCTVAASNYLPVPVEATIDVASNPLLQTRSVTAPAKKSILGAKWSGTLAPALAPAITSVATIEPGTSPGGGYLPLSEFGIAPTALTDEQILNFTVPSFLYGSETYTSIGVVSNGYVVVGGGGTGDVLFEPNGVPNPTAPNNVLAPLWTDLNPENAPADGGIRVGTLTDGVTSWLIVDYDRVPTWSGNAVNSFQTWIELGGTEGAWFNYGADAVGDAGAGVLTGAENRDGTSGATLSPLPVSGDEVAVTTAPPTAGGTVSFDYTLRGLAKGSWTTGASLRSDALRAVPLETTKITVK